MRKCSIMFALFIMFLVIASKVLKAENELNQNLVVENKKLTIIQP